MSTAISVENISKQYRLGQVGTGTLSDDLTRFWHRIRGKEDPFLKIGQTNDRTKKADATDTEKKSGLLSRLSPLATRNSSADLVWALKDINFEVKEGEVLGIIGRNGAGKSTLLKILARVTTPTTGQVKVKGRIASLLEVGTGFHPDLSGRENIYLNGAILGMRKHEITRKLDEIIDFSGCDRYIDTPVKRYSSGMYVRLAFAVAAHLDPEILIVDEVLAVGDAEFQKKCLGKMKDVSLREGRTVLFVSHNMPAVSALCSSAIVMTQGMSGPRLATDEAIESYLHLPGKLSVDLDNRPDRRGRNQLRFTKVTLHLADNGQPHSSLICGADAKVRMHYISTGISACKVVVAFNIKDNFDRALAHVSSEDTREFRPLISDCGYFECRLPRLPFRAGNYSCNLFCSFDGEIEDWIEDAFSLAVEDGDFHGSGRLPSRNAADIVPENSWVHGQS